MREQEATAVASAVSTSTSEITIEELRLQRHPVIAVCNTDAISNNGGPVYNCAGVVEPIIV